MKIGSRALSFAALFVTTALFASADTVYLGSFGTNNSNGSAATNPGFGNTATYFAPNQPALPSGAYQPVTGSTNTYNLADSGTWAGPLSVNGMNSTYVSLAPGTGHGGTVVEPNGAYGYHSYFSATSAPIVSGFITVLADDTLDLYLNGHQLVFNSNFAGNTFARCSDVAPGCTTPLTVLLPQADLLTGSTSNDLYFVVHQDALFATGLDFVGSVSSVPEPSALVLLGTGLIGSAGAMFRRLRVAA